MLVLALYLVVCALTSWGVVNGSNGWMMQTKGITACQRKESGCVQPQAYRGAAIKYE